MSGLNEASAPGSPAPATDGTNGPQSAPSAPSSQISGRRLTPAEEVTAVEKLLGWAKDDGEGEAGENGAEAGEADFRGADGLEEREAEGEPKPKEAPQEGAEDRSARLSVKEAARRLGVSADQLYDALEISTGDGGWRATLGELKAAYAERESAGREAELRALEMDRREAGLANDMQLMGILAARNALPAEVIQQARAGLAEYSDREMRNLVALAPEFRDQEFRSVFSQEVEAMLKPYGVNAASLGVVPAGLRLFMRDVLRMQKRLGKLTTQPAPLPRAGKPQGRFGASPAKKPGPNASQAEREAYVARLIGEGG